MRQAFRRRLLAFTELGVPVDRLGLMLGFQSGRGAAGREGLEPTSAWLDYVKVQALAAREIAAETGIATIWSWGWGTFGPQSADADKAAAACVYLWARDPQLCDAPTRLPADSFDPSLAQGPIVLEQGSICETGDGRIEDGDLAVMTAIWRNRGRAFTHLLARIAEEAEAGVPEDEIDAAEARIVAQRFGGDPAAYNAAVAALGLNARLARALIADQLRRGYLVGLVPVPPPLVHGGRHPLRRRGAASGRAACGSRPPRRGCAARRPGRPSRAWRRPRSSRAGRAARSPSARDDGRFRVRILAKRERMRDVPLATVYPQLADVLRERARERGLDGWLLTLQRNALATAVCQKDVHAARRRHRRGARGAVPQPVDAALTGPAGRICAGGSSSSSPARTSSPQRRQRHAVGGTRPPQPTCAAR